jgi:hypothetical protein
MFNTFGDNIIERIILESYIERLKKFGVAPSTISVMRNCDSVIYKNAYDAIYSELKNRKIDDNIVHNVLSRYQCVHSYDGVIYFVFMQTSPLWSIH